MTESNTSGNYFYELIIFNSWLASYNSLHIRL